MKKSIFILLAIAAMLMMVAANGFFKLKGPAGKKAASAYYLFTGKVTDVDLKTNKIVITAKTSESFQFVVNDKTVITKAGKVIALSGIKKTDSVKANYCINQGKRIAGSIAVFRQHKASAKASSPKRIK